MENTEDLACLDRHLAIHVTETRDTESVVENLQKAITMSCNKTFKSRENTRKPTKQKPVLWWTKELTTKRKRLNSLRRRYQRTKNNEELREYRKDIYYEEKLKYQSTIKKEKLKSWKAYCNLTPCINPWNAVYKLATNKAKRSQTLSTLHKPDGSLSSDLNETMKIMVEYLIPKDEQTDDTD